MWIKLKTLMAGPEGVFLPGTVIELPEAQGAQLVDSGQAEEAPVKTEAKAKAKKETAASKQAKEREIRGTETGDGAGE